MGRGSTALADPFETSDATMASVRTIFMNAVFSPVARHTSRVISGITAPLQHLRARVGEALSNRFVTRKSRWSTLLRLATP